MSCLGNLERGRGGSLASGFGGSCSRVDLACFHGKTFWRVCLAGQFGGSVWRVNLAHSFGGFSQAMKRHAVEQEKEKKRKGIYYQ